MELSGAHTVLSEWKCRNYFEMRGGKGRRRRKREEGIEDTISTVIILDMLFHFLFPFIFTLSAVSSSFKPLLYHYCCILCDLMCAEYMCAVRSDQNSHAIV